MLEPKKIMPYYGFGNENYVYLKGRVLEDEKTQDDQGEPQIRKVRG